MKKQIYLFAAIIVISSIFMTSCTKEENPDPLNKGKGTITFSVNFQALQRELTKSNLKAGTINDAKEVIITIKNIDGSPTDYTSSVLKLNEMGGTIYTQKIALSPGSYNLTEFSLVDATGNVIFATPGQGSVASQNVSQALPITIMVVKDQTTPLTIEVVSTEGYTPEDFGYARFPITEIKTFSFLIGVSDATSNELLSSSIKITSGTYNLVDNLYAKTNNVITIKAGLAEYTLTVEKNGYKSYSQVFTNEELKGYQNKPIIIELEKNISVNLALNTNGYGYPSPEESDNGWGGGTNKWDLLDGKTGYTDTWAKGLAFTGGTPSWGGAPCGWRQATVNFGVPKTFKRVVVYHHGDDQIPNVFKIEVWDGSAWIEVMATNTGHDYINEVLRYTGDGWGSVPTDVSFTTVTASKVRFVFNNCDMYAHGWLYELQVFNN